MSPRQFAVDVPVTDLNLGDDIDDFHIQDEETEDEFHRQMDLHDFDFGSRPNIIQRGINAIGSIFKKSNNPGRDFNSLANGEYVDDIELLSRGRSDGNNSFDLDSDFYHFKQSKKGIFWKYAKTILCSKILIFPLLLSILGLLIALIVIVSKRSKPINVPKPFEEAETSVSSLLTIVLSISGLHPHFISFENMPYLSDMINSSTSVYSPFMIPSNPTLNLPNLWTISTGLKPYQNGIIGQSFYDKELNEQFNTDNFDVKWYQGKPIWDLVEENNLKFRSLNWPFTDSDVKIENTELFTQLEKFKSLISTNQTNLILTHVNNLESKIQSKGLNGSELKTELIKIDDHIQNIFHILESNQLDANVMVISEGGYAPISKDRTLKLESVIDLNKFQYIEKSTIIGLYPKIDNDIDILVEEIKTNLEKSSIGENFTVSKSVKVEDHVYGGRNDRIPPILIIPNVGYLIDYDVDNKNNLKCTSGYLSDNLLSRSMFIASGPFFNSFNNIKPFENIEIYNMITDSLEITSSKSIFSNPDYVLPEDWQDNKEYPGTTGFELDILQEESVIEVKYGVKELRPVIETEPDKIDGIEPTNMIPEAAELEHETSDAEPETPQPETPEPDSSEPEQETAEPAPESSETDKSEQTDHDEFNDEDTDNDEKTSRLSAWWDRISSAIDRVIEDVEDKFGHDEDQG